MIGRVLLSFCLLLHHHLLCNAKFRNESHFSALAYLHRVQVSSAPVSVEYRERERERNEEVRNAAERAVNQEEWKKNKKGGRKQQRRKVSTQSRNRTKHKRNLILNVHVCHTAPQTGLQRLRIPLKQPHHTRPTQTGEHRPAILLHQRPLLLGQLKEAFPSMSPILTPHQSIISRRLNR